MKYSSGFRMILTAMFASMVCVCTMCVQIPSPMNGYVNLGDAMVLMSAFLLGPVYGTAAAGIGSALADVLTGYLYYAPGTLVIKGGIALIACMLLKLLDRHAASLPRPLRMVIAGIPGEIFMVLGYLFYAWVPLSNGIAALASVPGNLMQGAAGIAISAMLTPLVLRPHEIQDMLAKFHRNSQ